MCDIPKGKAWAEHRVGTVPVLFIRGSRFSRGMPHIEIANSKTVLVKFFKPYVLNVSS